MPCGQEAKRRIFGDLPVEHCDELIHRRRPVEPLVQILEQPSRDVARDVQFVQCPHEKRLVKHRREHSVRAMMAGNIDQRDPGLPAAEFEVAQRRPDGQLRWLFLILASRSYRLLKST